jgi:uncharacterized protein DUF6285
MRDISDAADLMTTAREALLRDLLPALPPQHRYSALMIANGMAIAAREHRLGADAARSEAARLRNLLADPPLPAPPSNELPSLRRMLCAAIRAGRFDAPAMAARLTNELAHTAESWVAISNPKALRTASAPTAGSEA